MVDSIRINDNINGGPVQLKLRLNEPLTWYQCQAHDEGWSSTTITWEYTGDFIRYEITCDGRDCDGRCTTTTTYAAVVDPVLRRQHNPTWIREDSRSYDQFAEMMNY